MSHASASDTGRWITTAVLLCTALSSCGGRSLPGGEVSDRQPDASASGGAGDLDAGGGISNSGSGGTGGVGPGMGGVGPGTGGALGVGGLGAGPECPAAVILDQGSSVSIAGDTSTGSLRYRGSCGGEGRELLFAWRAPATGRYQFDTFGSEVDTVLSLGSGFDCDHVDEVACSDDAFAGPSSWIVADVVAGPWMVIVVDSYEDPGPFVLNIRPVVEPTCPEGDLGSALGRPVATGTVALEARGDDDNACDAGPPRISYLWQAPHSGFFVFDTFGSEYDTVLLLRRECFAAAFDCNDDSNGVQSQLEWSLAQGERIVVEVAAFRHEACVDCGALFYQLNIEELAR